MDHHDYGGLHEDLKLTGAAMKRRDMLRLATGGVGIGALYLLGRADDLQGIGGAAATCDKIPEDTAGPFPGDGFQRAQCPRQGGRGPFNRGATEQNYPLRGLPQPGRGDGRAKHSGDLAARVSRGRLRLRRTSRSDSLLGGIRTHQESAPFHGAL